MQREERDQNEKKTAIKTRRGKEESDKNLNLAMKGFGISQVEEIGEVGEDGNPSTLAERVRSAAFREKDEILPNYFQQRETHEGIELVFDEVDKDSIFSPIIRTADSVGK